MTFQVTWKQQGQTTLYITGNGLWRWDHFDTAAHKVIRVMQTLREPVIVMVDLNAMDDVPEAAVPTLQAVFDHSPRNLVRVMIVCQLEHVRWHFTILNDRRFTVVDHAPDLS